MKSFTSYINETTYSASKVSAIIAKLAKVKEHELEDGKRIVIDGYPGNIYDETDDGEGIVNIIAVDLPAAKGIKGALMKAGITAKLTGKSIDISIK